ncbi:MAG: hypothetical protein K0S47_360 [Herbinix sp.]|jgi:hypothetical protein|nr:hypothetical protein [Herbinix sp.]
MGSFNTAVITLMFDGLLKDPADNDLIIIGLYIGLIIIVYLMVRQLIGEAVITLQKYWIRSFSYRSREMVVNDKELEEIMGTGYELIGELKHTEELIG